MKPTLIETSLVAIWWALALIYIRLGKIVRLMERGKWPPLVPDPPPERSAR